MRTREAWPSMHDNGFRRRLAVTTRVNAAQGRDALLSPHSSGILATMHSGNSLGNSVVSVAYTCGRARRAALYHAPRAFIPAAPLKPPPPRVSSVNKSCSHDAEDARAVLQRYGGLHGRRLRPRSRSIQLLLMTRGEQKIAFCNLRRAALFSIVFRIVYVKSCPMRRRMKSW